ncbi:MAG: hypothetical protein WAW23_06905 [Candidatus Methanoperedens sp.]
MRDSNFRVNLRPDGADDIISPDLASTDAGKVLLEADLQLKKDTAAFTSPQTPEGKQYWDKLYAKAQELFGSEDVEIPALTRPWIVPDEIIIGEGGDNAYIFKATLKVMLEQDRIEGSSDFDFSDNRVKILNEYTASLIRQLIIPKLNREINLSRRYASLRQVYYSLILAQWFKQKYRGNSGFYSSLIDSGNLNGLTSKTTWSPATYFQAYKDSFSRGEYNITERSYSKGGWTLQTYV